MNTKLNCPSCRREYVIHPGRSENSKCSRCECELESLIRIRQAASELVRLSWAALAASEYHLAMKHAEMSWSLLHTSESAESGLISSVLIKDWKKVKLWIHRTQR